MDNQHWIAGYLPVNYLDGGRDFNGMDCWGLVRHVLHYQFNLPLFESYGHVNPDDKRSLTEAFTAEVKSFIPSSSKASAVAAGFRGQLLLHIGVCVEVNSQLYVLETSRKNAVALTKLRDFKRQYSRIEFYSYVSNSQSIS